MGIHMRVVDLPIREILVGATKLLTPTPSIVEYSSVQQLLRAHLLVSCHCVLPSGRKVFWSKVRMSMLALEKGCRRRPFLLPHVYIRNNGEANDGR